MKKILILGTSLASVEIVQSANNMGCYTVVTDNLPPELSLAKYEADEYWMISTGDIDQLEEKCKKESINAVFTGISEFNLDRVKELTDRLGLPHARGGEIFVLDMGNPIKIDTLARNMIRLSGYKPDVDIKIEYTGLRPGEKLYEEKLMAEEGLTKTENDLIFIGKPIPFDTDKFLIQLKELMYIAYKNKKSVREQLVKMVSTYHPENVGRKKDAETSAPEDKRRPRVANEAANKNKFRPDTAVSPRVAAISMSKPISAGSVSAMMGNVNKIG